MSNNNNQRPRWVKVLRVVLLSFAAFIIILAVAFKGPILPPEPLPDSIIDVHAHTAGLGGGDSGCFISDSLRKNFRFEAYMNAFGVDRERLLNQGDAVMLEHISHQVAACPQIKAAVILAMDGVITDGELDRDQTEIYIPNDFLARETAKYDNLLFGAGINPYRKDWRERLQAAADQGAVLVKWLPSIQHIDPADPDLRPFYQEMVRLNLPLLSHTGDEHSFTYAINELADPNRLALPLEEGVTVIAAHVATIGKNEGVPNFQRLVTMMKTYPNLYADISSLTQINKPDHLAQVLADPLVRERLIYGSDFPVGETPLVAAWHHLLRLTPSQIRRLSAIDNPWRFDLELKQALGVPAAVFNRTAQLLQPPAE